MVLSKAKRIFGTLRREWSGLIFVIVAITLISFQLQKNLLDRQYAILSADSELRLMQNMDSLENIKDVHEEKANGYNDDVSRDESDAHSQALRYSLQEKFKLCNEVHRPNRDDVEWRKSVYQEFKFRVNGYGDFDAFILRHYFDDRFFHSHKERYVRAPVVILGPGPLDPIEEHRDTLKWAWAMNRARFNVLLWYDGMLNPIATTCEHQTAAGLTRNVSNSYYFQQIMHCPIPEIDRLPSHTSLTYDVCSQAKTYTRVMYPRPPRFPGARDIGVCMASLYGTLNKTRISYIINWMEALKMFGVIEVSINNASFEFGDSDIEKTFQYYMDKGEMIMTHYPVIHEHWTHNRKQNDDASESVNKITTGDCFYRNLKRYWYTLIIDMDELPVPMKHNTYREYLEYFLAEHPNLTEAHGLIIRTAFFNMNFKPGNPDAPEYLPILRYTNRFRPEPIEDSHDGVGISKSFHNPRNCVASGHHLCRQGHDRRRKVMRETMPPEDILIHHYRLFCKYKNDCKKFKDQLINDKILPEKYSTEITARVVKVMRDLNFL